MKVRIRLDTLSDINDFVEAASLTEERVELSDNDGHCVSAKSILGAMYSFEWNEVYCFCEKDISTNILRWII